MAKKNKTKKENDMDAILTKSAMHDKLDDFDEVEEIGGTDVEQVPESREELDIDSALELLNNGEIFIDRDKENMDITEFQKTGDLVLLEKVYKNRIPTLKSWASRNYYPGLTSSVEDLFEDLSVVFVKAARDYDKGRGASFNTCLFTFLVNRLKNLKSSKYAKKRKSDEYTGALSNMILSLDFQYNDGDGSDLTLKDIIPGKEDSEESLDFRDSLSFLSKGNPVTKEFFKKISDGNSLASLLKEYKERNGKIDLSDDKPTVKKLNSRKNKHLVTEIIKSHNVLNGSFKLLEYELDGNYLRYKVEMRKTKETDNILKTIRDLKKHKDFYISKLRGC